MLLPALCFATQMDSSFALGDLDPLVSSALEKIASTKYAEADKLAEEISGKNAGVGCVVKGMTLIGRYDDLGDTAAIQKATLLLSRCRSEGFWDALRVFELGYSQSEQGHSLKGAMNTRSAAKVFKDSDDMDAKAFYAIYAYYMEGAFSWVPFVSDNRPEHIKSLASGAASSKLFWPLFTTSLAWMFYDRGEFSEALLLTESALSRVPRHPVFLQIKADMLYRLGRYAEAAEIYEASANDYLKRTGKSIRYWCAAANLVRIYADKGDAEAQEKWRKTLKTEEFEAIRSWMPSSLMDDLKKRKLL